MIFAILIRLGGGFWAYRERCKRTRSPFARRCRKFIYSHYLEYLGSYIAIDAVFDGPPKFPHKPMGIFIAPGVRVGINSTIYQQVTLGSNEISTSKGFGSPSLGDGVFIGAGAKVIGGVTVGQNARIGAGAVVVRDVPAFSTVVSQPPVIFRSKE
jgi:serine O-acetyltransferase